MDLSRGISGDMFISALADTGVDFGRLEQAFIRSGIQVRIDISQVKRNGIMGMTARITWKNEQPLRTLEHILPIIQSLDISPAVRQKSVKAFHRLAEVEASVHGEPKEKVHFHEIGALDTLIDIVGAFWGLEALGIEEVTSTPMPWFGGEAEIAHGLITLPAPATSILMQGKQIRPSNYDWEIITPTGALIVDQLVSDFAGGFHGKLAGSGIGFGKYDRGFNGLRIFLWEDEPSEQYLLDRVWLLESNIDHLTGEEIGLFFQKIMDAGALDVIFLQGIMKKNRSGGQIQVMCHDENLNRVREEFFRQTLTLGMRISQMCRNTLPRRESWISLEGGQVKACESLFCGRRYIRPEMESLAELGAKKDMSIVELRLKKKL